MIQWTDLLPTLIEAAGGKTPEGVDGRSFLSVLRGEKSSHCEQIFATHSCDSKMNVYPIRALRTRDWIQSAVAAERSRRNPPHPGASNRRDRRQQKEEEDKIMKLFLGTVPPPTTRREAVTGVSAIPDRGVRRAGPHR